MLAIVLALLPSTTGYEQALAWADRLYALSAPLPQEPPGHAFRQALPAYEIVAAKYGNTPAVAKGRARCLMGLGQYDEAQYWFGQAGASDERKVAEDSRSVKSAAKAFVTGEGDIARVVRVPNSDLWFALAGSESEGYGGGTEANFYWEANEFRNPILYLFRTRPSGLLALVGRPLVIDTPYEPRTAALLVMDISGRGDYAAITYIDFLSADSWRTQVNVFKPSLTGPKQQARFSGKAETVFHRLGKPQHLVFQVTPTWKVWWPDLYEWTPGGFAFANSRYPQLYQVKGVVGRGFENYYPAYVSRAATLCIHKRFREARLALLAAERICRLSLRGGADKDGYPKYPDYGFYGDTFENVKQSRQRIRWIERHEFNHDLLYRPYDFDLQVPPYRLGSARMYE